MRQNESVAVEINKVFLLPSWEIPDSTPRECVEGGVHVATTTATTSSSSASYDDGVLP
jgi:hypothetical protein